MSTSPDTDLTPLVVDSLMRASMTVSAFAAEEAEAKREEEIAQHYRERACDPMCRED